MNGVRTDRRTFIRSCAGVAAATAAPTACALPDGQADAPDFSTALTGRPLTANAHPSETAARHKAGTRIEVRALHLLWSRECHKNRAGLP